MSNSLCALTTPLTNTNDTLVCQSKIVFWYTGKLKYLNATSEIICYIVTCDCRHRRRYYYYYYLYYYYYDCILRNNNVSSYVILCRFV
jgi:hypothetical protein